MAKQEKVTQLPTDQELYEYLESLNPKIAPKDIDQQLKGFWGKVQEQEKPKSFKPRN